MSRASSLGLIAALSAAGGAAVTAAALHTFGSSKTAAATHHANAPPFPSPSSGPSSAAYPPAALPATKTFPPATPAAGPPVDPAGFFQYGFPGPVADLATRSSLVSSYDRRTRNPHWVVEHITPASLASREGNRKGSAFREDQSVPAQFRARLADYFRSGYDRGHQVPAADARWSQEAMDDTFYLSNMCPQVGEGFNRDYWAHLEDFCRRLTSRYPSVRVATGPLYLPRRDAADGKWYVKYEVIGDPANVAVPTHFYKVVLAEDGRTGGEVAVGAFVLPNARIPNDAPLAGFEVPLEVVERASGLEFAAELPAARRKRLCAVEGDCSIVVRDFADKSKAKALPAPRK